jgi:hypothetical protein
MAIIVIIIIMLIVDFKRGLRALIVDSRALRALGSIRVSLGALDSTREGVLVVDYVTDDF